MSSIMSPPTYTVSWVVSSSAAPVELVCTRSWSPLGSDRFYSLLQAGYYTENVAFFRVVPNFIIQFGITGNVTKNKLWDTTIKDDPTGVKSNTKGTLTFATAGPDTRTTQLFVNLVDNARLDDQGFTPLCEVREGMQALERYEFCVGPAVADETKGGPPSNSPSLPPRASSVSQTQPPTTATA